MMRDPDRVVMSETADQVGRKDVDEFPLTVAEDWDELVRKADAMAHVIDKHLEFEIKLQGRELKPTTLCPEQKVSLVSDLSSV